MFKNIPEELKLHGSFCLWRYEERKGRMTKVPYSLDGTKANPADKTTFANFRLAAGKVADGYSGIGLGIFNGFCAIDIDDCVAGGTTTAMAQDIIDTMKSYTETSPSGNGIRIIFKAGKLTYDTKRFYINNQKLGLEVYVAGATKKFVTLTGNALNELAVEERSAEILAVLEKYMLRPKAEETAPKTAPPGSYLGDASVIAKASASKNGSKFLALWNGDQASYQSQSEADIALANMLAYWCGGDIEQMDRLFRQSGLMRDKWDRAQSGSTYGRLTLDKAVQQTTEFYRPVAKPTADEDFNPIVIKLNELNPAYNRRYSPDDQGNGRLFADVFHGIARYVPERKSWFIYDHTRWVQDIGSLQTMELCKELADKLWIYIGGIKDEKVRNNYAKEAQKWKRRTHRLTIINDAQSVHPIAARLFDSNKLLFNCSNGTLELDSMEFRAHSPEDFITKISPVTYDPSARCPRFESFIMEIMTDEVDKAKFLQKVLGLSLSGETNIEALYLFYGATTRNGKGSLMESIKAAMGDYGISVRPETLAQKNAINSSAPSEDIARLAGVRFINISEPERSMVLNAALLKSLTGNDSISARKLHENSYDFKVEGKFYISSNYKPVVTDCTLFQSGRIIVVPFNRHFDESEQDTTLKSQFEQPEAQSAILNWLIEGYKMVKAEGLLKPQCVVDAVKEYAADSDKVGQFFDECLVQEPNAELRMSEAYSSYNQWCLSNGYHCENVRNFNAEVKRRYPQAVKRKRPKAVKGEKTTMLIGFRRVGLISFLG